MIDSLIDSLWRINFNRILKFFSNFFSHFYTRACSKTNSFEKRINSITNYEFFHGFSSTILDKKSVRYQCQDSILSSTIIFNRPVASRWRREGIISSRDERAASLSYPVAIQLPLIWSEQRYCREKMPQIRKSFRKLSRLSFHPSKKQNLMHFARGRNWFSF